MSLAWPKSLYRLALISVLILSLLHQAQAQDVAGTGLLPYELQDSGSENLVARDDDIVGNDDDNSDDYDDAYQYTSCIAYFNYATDSYFYLSTPHTFGPPSNTIRSIPSTTPLSPYNPTRYVIKPGEVHVYSLNGTDFISDDAIAYFATATLCDKPDWDPDGSGMRMQLATNFTSLINSTNSTGNLYYNYFERGFSNVTLVNMPANSTLNSMAYLVVSAPTAHQLGVTGDVAVTNNDTWTYEAGMSTTAPLHQVINGPNLYLVDTDFAHVLLLSGNMTKPYGDDDDDDDSDDRDDDDDGSSNTGNYTSDLFYTNTSTYYGLQIFESNSSNSLMGLPLDQSYCAVSTSRQALLNVGNAEASVTTRGADKLPKIQYFMGGLNRSKSYVAYLTETTNRSSSVNSSTVFGGKVFAGVNFTTKAETNCQLIYDLDLCSDVAFAVPGNADKFTAKALADAYDSNTRELYDQFNLSMQVIQCGDDIDPSDRYSILRTCDDCRESYRQWLCATTIPRCEDSSNTASYLFRRDTNMSRNPFINENIQPGPYNELLPCIDLCHGIMQDCPSSFQFQCPKRSLPGFTGAYYIKEGTDVTCNYPGVVYVQSGAASLVRNILAAVVVSVLVILM